MSSAPVIRRRVEIPKPDLTREVIDTDGVVYANVDVWWQEVLRRAALKKQAPEVIERARRRPPWWTEDAEPPQAAGDNEVLF